MLLWYGMSNAVRTSDMLGVARMSPRMRAHPMVASSAGALAMNGAPSDGAAGARGHGGGGERGSRHEGVDQGVRHARTVSVLAIAEIAGKVASFVMFAVAARLLGPAEFGQFTWSFNLALLLSAFVIWDSTSRSSKSRAKPVTDSMPCSATCWRSGAADAAGAARGVGVPGRSLGEHRGQPGDDAGGTRRFVESGHSQRRRGHRSTA